MQTESMNATIYGGTSEGLVMIQIENSTGTPVWAYQTYFTVDGYIISTLTIPETWPPGVSTFIAKDFSSGNIEQENFLVTEYTPSIVEFSLNLTRGWNMVSLPVTPDDSNASTVLDGVGWYQLVMWNRTGYYEAEVMEAGEGYWLLVLDDVNVSIIGVPVTEVSLNLTRGWTLSGGPYGAVDADAAFPGFYQLVSWIEQGYYLSSSFKSGLGYWVLVLNNMMIRLIPL